MISGAGFAHQEEPAGGGEEFRGVSGGQKSVFAVSIVLLVVGIYCTSVTINFSHHDWTHRHISAGIGSLHSAWQLFIKPQADGFYRPLTFLSLWLDYRWFGTVYAGYHLQSIALHCINSLMVAWLAMSLGLSKKCALWAGFLFAAAAVNFEAVIWPAARFDLLATLFTLLALILIIRYLRDTRLWTWTAAASLCCYVLGILNKESSYCFPLLLLFILCTHSLWSIPRPTKAKIMLCLSLVAAATVLMLGVRIAVYGSLGGYPTAAGVQSFHFRTNIKTFISFIRAIPIPVLGFNTTSTVRDWGRLVPVLFVVPILLLAFLCRGCFKRKEYALIGFIILSLAPVLNIVGWIGSWMQHSRYVYMPTVFVMLLIASTAVKIRWSTGILAAFMLINAFGAASNIRVYRDMMERATSLAEIVHSDWEQQQSVRTICLLNLPEHTDGVFYFGSEVADQIGKRIPGAAIVRLEALDAVGPDSSRRLLYSWNKSERTLNLIARQ
jgi:hypothetical protein